MAAKSTATFSLDSIDQDEIKRLAAEAGWSKTQVIREALVALDRGLERHRLRLAGELKSEPKLDDQAAVLYRRVVKEAGFAITLQDVGSSRTDDGAPVIEIDGYRYTVNREDKLIATRPGAVQDGIEWVDVFEPCYGGLLPRGRAPWRPAQPQTS